MEFALNVTPSGWAILLLVLLLSAVIYLLTMTPKNYWEEQGFLHAPPQSFLKSILQIFDKRLHEIDLERYKKYGKIFGAYEGTAPILMIGDPDLLRNILVKDFFSFPSRRSFQIGDPVIDNMLSGITGEKWKRIRTIISPAFTTGKLKRMTDIILNSAKTVVKNFESKAGKPIDCKIFFSTFTMDVIASAAFATKVQSYEDPNNRFIVEANKVFRPKITWRALLFILFPRIFKLLGIGPMAPSARNFFKEATLEIVANRRRTGKIGKDFLQLLMDAEKETQEQDNEKNLEDEENMSELKHDGNDINIFKISSKNRYMTQDELVAQCVIFFLAGYETTATTLTLASYMLALNPDVQDKLREEVDAAIQNNDGKLTYDAVQEIKHLDHVISETLRLFPPAPRVDRVADEDYKLGDTGYTIKKGTVVIAPVFAMHRDPEYYPEPEKFRPERFAAAEKAKRHPYTYLPFGAGPRNCIGMRFALMEIKLCLAYVISQLRIKSCPEQEPLKITSFGLLTPRNAMICVEKREDRVLDGL